MASTTKQTIGVGLIGVGSIGRFHAENLANNVPDAALIGIADVFVEAAKRAGDVFGVSNIYSDYNQLLSNHDVEAVVVATPPFLKKEIVLRAAQAGKHVFVEKPMTLTLKECDEIIKETERAGIKVQVGYQRRFDTSFLRAYEAIRSGEIGKIQLISSCTRDPPGKPLGWALDPKLSGGLMLDTCSHDFDAIRWLAAMEVAEVYAKGANLVYEEYRPNKIPDNTVVTLTLKDQSLGYVDSCQWTVYGYDVRTEVVGTEGAAFIGTGDRTSTLILSKSGFRGEYPQNYIERFGQAYRDELVDFVRCIREDRQPKVTARDGRAAVEIGIAATKSLDTNTPVSLPLS